MAQLLRLSVKGNLPSGEVWSVNPCWTISDFGVTTTPLQIQAVATACVAVTPNATFTSNWATSTTLHTIRVEARSANGNLENLAEAVKGTPTPGTGSNPHPFQTAWVTSLRTAQVGASGRGRLYWPATAVTLASGTLRPSTFTTDGFLAGVKTYLSGLQTAIRVTFPTAGLIVWSRKTQGMYLVDTLQSGDILDTQRRRRDNVTEAYSQLVYP